MGPDDVVRLRNIHPTRAFSDGYSGKVYTIDPGSETFIPFAAACLWFGHPEAVDVGPGKEFRMEEKQRLNVRYGVFEDPNITKDQMWENNTPRVEVFDLHGAPITMVLHDPEGRDVTMLQESLSERDMLLQRMEDMQKQMKVMQTQIDASNRGEVAAANSGPIDPDAPPLPTVPPVGPGVTAPAIVPGTTPVSPIASDPIPSDEPVSEDAPTRVKVGPR